MQMKILFPLKFVAVFVICLEMLLTFLKIH